MQKTLIKFNETPKILPTLFRALFLPRKGANENSSFPNLAGEQKNVKINPKNLKNYIELCELNANKNLPPLYPHVLAGPLHMHILTHPDFPLKLLGAVHKYNTVKIIKNFTLDDKLDIFSQLCQPKYFNKGLEFEIKTVVKVKDEICWEETSTYFVKKKFPQLPEGSSPNYIDQINANKELANWKLSTMAGKKYAMICKDFNPIHISKPLAKLFGFKKDLVHGMCSAAQCLGKINIEDYQGKTIKKYFKGPSFIGSQLHLKVQDDTSNRFDLFCENNERPVISIGIE